MMSTRAGDDSPGARREALHLFLQISPNTSLGHVLWSPTRLATIRILRNDQNGKAAAASQVCNFLRRALHFIPLSQRADFITGTTFLSSIEIGEAFQLRRNVWTAFAGQTGPADGFLKRPPPCFTMSRSPL